MAAAFNKLSGTHQLVVGALEQEVVEVLRVLLLEPREARPVLVHRGQQPVRRRQQDLARPQHAQQVRELEGQALLPLRRRRVALRRVGHPPPPRAPLLHVLHQRNGRGAAEAARARRTRRRGGVDMVVELHKEATEFGDGGERLHDRAHVAGVAEVAQTRPGITSGQRVSVRNREARATRFEFETSSRTCRAAEASCAAAALAWPAAARSPCPWTPSAASAPA